jgi:hypothetical protein
MAQLDEFLTSAACSIEQSKPATNTYEWYCATLEEYFTMGDDMHERTISAISNPISKPNTRPIALMRIRLITRCVWNIHHHSFNESTRANGITQT